MQALRRKIIVVTLLFVTGPAFAAGSPTDFFAAGPGVIESAFGGAATAYAPDVSAYYYNPSLLPLLAQGTFSAAYHVLIDGSGYSYIAAGIPTNAGYYAIGGTMLRSGEGEARESIDDTPSSIISQQYAVNFAGGYTVPWVNVNVGASLKYYSMGIGKYSGSSYGLDVGLSKSIMTVPILRERSQLSFGAMARNVYMSSLKLVNEAETYPMHVSAGIGYRVPLWLRYSPGADIPLNDQLILLCDGDFNIDDNTSAIRFGGEYSVIDSYFVRAGWNNSITGGFGYKADAWQVDYSIDMKPLSPLHKIGITLYWGKRQSLADSKEIYSNGHSTDIQHHRKCSPH
jgi:hypothetical protein